MLDVGEAIVVGDALTLPVPLHLDPPSVPPASVTMPYWQAWSQRESSQTAIAAGVEALRNQWRGELTGQS
jgi:hypothetical protein